MALYQVFQTSHVGEAVAYAIPAGLCLAAHTEIKSLPAPLAGPFAARLFGHSCGAIDNALAASVALIFYGVLVIVMAANKQRELGLLPFWV